MYKISVIMTTYQAEDTVKKAIESVLDSMYSNQIELVIVDDCSKDSTVSIIEEYQFKYPNIKLFIMPQNSGSPSRPRNLGIQKAQGKYVTFLDDDDTIKADSLLKMVEIVEYEDVDYAKGYLIAIEGDKKSIANRMKDSDYSNLECIKHMFILQSMNSDFIVRRSLLIDNGIEYDGSLKIGEDTVFVASIMETMPKVKYIDDFFHYYNKTPLTMGNLSSTQNWGDKEVTDQLRAWTMTQRILKNIGLDYFKIRLSAGVRNVLISLVQRSKGISEECFNVLSTFVNENHKFLTDLNLSERYQQVYDAILARNFPDYEFQVKKRIVIAGYDLKFVLPLVPILEKHYNVRVDEWTGHNSHDDVTSREMAQWADIIWCEWLLGNAVYYTKIKNNNQRLIIRAHRFELWREFGHEVDYRKVDLFFCVGYHYLEKFSEKFNIPKKIVRLLSNYVEDDIYVTEKEEEYQYHIGLVGILPARKGFHRALKLIDELIKINPRFRLVIMGKKPEEISWIANNPKEQAYYDDCQSYINENNLSDYIIYTGYLPRAELYTKVGYVLSLSDNENPESFHLSIAEGACAGSMGLAINWSGIEYIYPEFMIFDQLEEIKSEILKASGDLNYFNSQVTSLSKYVKDNYSMNVFETELELYMRRLFY